MQGINITMITSVKDSPLYVINSDKMQFSFQRDRLYMCYNLVVITVFCLAVTCSSEA